MYENGPLNSGDYGEDSPDHTTTDYELWEAELKDNENIARLSHELGRFSLQNEIEVTNILRPEEEPEEEEEELEEEPETDDELISMETSHSSGDDYLLSDEMYGAAMGLIYLTTGIPADEMMK